MIIDTVLRAGALVIGLYLAMFGIGAFLSGLLPGPRHWLAQYLVASLSMSCAYYMLWIFFVHS